MCLSICCVSTVAFGNCSIWRLSVIGCSLVISRFIKACSSIGNFSCIPIRDAVVGCSIIGTRRYSSVAWALVLVLWRRLISGRVTSSNSLISLWWGVRSLSIIGLGAIRISKILIRICDISIGIITSLIC